MLDGEQDAPQSAARGAKRATTPPRRADSQKSKRVRVSRACDQCRAGREKCDGGQPSCHTCEAQERVCSYHEQPKKRGIQPNYIRTLELTLAWIFQNSPDSETRISQELPDATGSAHRLIAWKDANASEGLHAAWRSSIVCRQIDQLLSGASIDIPQHTASDGRASEVPYQSPPLSAPSDNSIPLNTSTFDALSPTNSRNPQSALVSSSDLLRLPENSWALLEHYLAFTQTWLPIVERHDILKLMYTYPTTGLPYKDAREAGHAELWSIMALASFQLGGTNSDAEHCRNIVRSLIPQEHGFQLGHIKALLVLSLLDLMKDAKVSAWLTVGSAVRLLTHFHFGKGTNTTLFEGRTKHTVLAAFVLEHCVASHTGAIMHIRTADIRELGLLIEDGLEEWSPWQDPSADASTGAARLPSRSISTFNECVRIAFQQDDKRANTLAGAGNDSVQSASSDIVLQLLQNSSSPESRSHPSAVIQSFRSKGSLAATVGFTADDAFTTPVSAANRLHHAPATNLDFMGSLMDHPFMAIPSASSPANQMQLDSPRPFSSDALATQQASNIEASTVANASADIFEDLALLERADSTANPTFMQNLGFGPDLDLAEFFGADYDPLLTYMQPPGFEVDTQGYDGSSKDAG